MKTTKLTNGTDIPVLGSGTNTFGKVNHDYMGEINGDTKELADAIKAGYRHFDTAISYRNEAVVGKALKNSGLKREEFFITSKLPKDPEYTESKEAVARGVQQSLDALGTDYIDLYLLHNPLDNPEDTAKVWHALEAEVKAGRLKEIGVSNFNNDQLAQLIKDANIKPAVNQVISNPNKWNHDIINFTKEQGVIPEAWSPLNISDEATKETLSKIGEKYDKSFAQVLLNFQLDRGVIVIPKSHDPNHQTSNLDVFDFDLTDEEKEKIAAL